MKKNSKVIFSLLFALIMVFQLGAPIASAASPEDVDVPLTVSISAELTPEQILALNPGQQTDDTIAGTEVSENFYVNFKTLQGLDYLTALSIQWEDKEISENAEALTLKELLATATDISFTLPANYYVSELDIVGNMSGAPSSVLKYADADACSANISLNPEKFLNEDGSLNDIIYTAPEDSEYFLTVQLSLIDDDGDGEDADIEDAEGNDFALAEGNTLPAAPAVGTDQAFAGWLLTYENGSSVLLQPGTAIAPYDDCVITPVIKAVTPPPAPSTEPSPEIEKYIIAASVKEGMKVETGLPLPTDYCVLAALPEGITLDGEFDYTLKDAEGNDVGKIAAAAGTYTVVLISSDEDTNVKVLKDGAELPAEQYNFNLSDGTVEYYSVSYPLPINIKAQAPVADGDGFKANGYVKPVEGLRDGDQLVDTGFSYEVRYEGTGAERKAYAVITGTASFNKGSGEAITMNKYAVTFLESERVAAPEAVTPPAAIEITVTAKAPVYDEASKSFKLPEAPVFEAVSGLADGDTINSASVQAEVKTDAQGKFYTEISSVEIVDKNNAKVADGKYKVTLVASEAVEAPKAEAILVTVTAKAPVYNKTTEKFEPASTFYSYTGTVDGDVLDASSVISQVVEEKDGAYLKITAAKAVDSKGNPVSADKYSFKFVDSEKVAAPEKEAKKVVITAKAPVLDSDGKTYIANGATVTGLTDQDKVKPGSLKYEVLFTADKKGVYVSISGAEIVHGGNPVPEGKYSIEYKDSSIVKIEETESGSERGAITIKPTDVKAEYDGKAHNARTDSCKITSGHLRQGDTVTKLEVKGSQTDAGTSFSEITKIVIKDENKKDVTAEYDITFAQGEVTVTKRPVTFTAITATVKRENDSQTIYASKLKLADGSFEGGYKAEGLLDGHKVSSITVNGSGSKPGSSFTSSVDKSSVKIMNGNNDVTANYEIRTVDGKVTLAGSEKPTEQNIPLTITAKSGTWTYDGKEHNCLEYTVDGLKDGDKVQKVTFKNSSRITSAGTVDNEIASVTIVDKNGNSVSSGKYSITYKKGSLTVDKYNLTVTAESASKNYDGKALVNKNVSIGKLANKDHKISVEYNIYTSKDKLMTSAPIEAGTYTKKITSVVIKDANGNDVTANYNIKRVDGTLTIKSSDKNNSNGPKTGDESNLTLWIAILGVSAAVIIAVVVIIILKNKKKVQEDEPQDTSEEENEGEFNINLEDFTDSSDSDNSDKPDDKQ